MKTIMTVLVVIFLALALGCESTDSPSRNGWEFEAETVDAGFDEPVDTGSLDTGPEDTGLVDTEPEDTGPEDTGLVDTEPEDTGPVDTGPVDTGPVDTETEDSIDFRELCTELGGACVGSGLHCPDGTYSASLVCLADTLCCIVRIVDTDTGTEDTDTVDTETEDTDTVDTETEDTETEDTDTVETDTVDTDTVDTDTVDTGPDPDPDPCDGVVCDEETVCGEDNLRWSYRADPTCVEGTCVYVLEQYPDEWCQWGCEMVDGVATCKDRPCGGPCEDPPESVCHGDIIEEFSYVGYCVNEECVYDSTMHECRYSCREFGPEYGTEAGVMCEPYPMQIQSCTSWEEPNDGLEWQKVENTDIMSQPEAVAYCEELNCGGHDDWRLPLVGELRTIITYPGCVGTLVIPGGKCTADCQSGITSASNCQCSLPSGVNAWESALGAQSVKILGSEVGVWSKTVGSSLPGAETAWAVWGLGTASAGPVIGSSYKKVRCVRKDSYCH